MKRFSIFGLLWIMLKMFIHFEYNATLICKLGDLDIKYSEYIDEHELDGSLLYNQDLEIFSEHGNNILNIFCIFHIFSGPDRLCWEEQFIDCWLTQTNIWGETEFVGCSKVSFSIIVKTVWPPNNHQIRVKLFAAHYIFRCIE